MIRYDNNKPSKREVAAEPPNQNEEKLERALRPKRLGDYVGQERIVEQIRITVQAAKMRGEPVDHVLLFGPPGLGKTTGPKRAQQISNFKLRLRCSSWS